MLLACIRGYLKAALKYKFLILDTYQLDTKYLSKRVCKNPWLFFEARRNSRAKTVWEILGYTIWGSMHFYWLQDVQNASDAHPASYSKGTRIFLGPGREVDRSSPSSAKIKNQRSYISYATSIICLHGVVRDNFCF